MKYEYNMIVIGAGSAGLVVASGAAGVGAKVALIEHEKMGGDCLNAGCVPSKSFLKCAHLAKDINTAETFGLETTLKQVNIEAVMKRVGSVIKAIEPHDSKERYEALGVDVIFGKGHLIDGHTVKIKDRTISARNIVIATGSEPVIPDIKGLDTVPYYTNKNIFDIKKLPRHLIVLGGGPIGLELGQGFRHLGSDVTIIDRGTSLFKKDDPEVAHVMQERFTEDGIKLQLNASILEVKKDTDSLIVVIEQNGRRKEIEGDTILVAVGRKPVSYDMGLQELGIKTDQRGLIQTDASLRTNIKNIYACGDVTGPYQFTHMAGYQARIVIKNTIFRLRSKVNYSTVPWTTYTKPEVAHVGYTEPWAKSLGLYKESIVVDLKGNDRAKAQNDIHGFLKLILDGKGRIIGATLVGEKAGEMIPVVSLAIKKKLRASIFLDLIFSYPTEAEIFASASLEKVKLSFRGWQKKMIQWILLR